MAGQTSIENGKKGGRPKAAHTISAEAGKALLISMYLERIKPINEALLSKAEQGDIQAIRELHDRVYNKATQPVSGENGGPIQIQVMKYE
jgi:hypothetical protein